MLIDDNGKIRIYGHEDVRSVLMKTSPRNIFLKGPYSVGKWTMLEQYVEVHGIPDILKFGKLTKDNIEEFASESKITKSSLRAIIFRLVRLPQNATEKLLKIIEDAPANVIFLCASTQDPGLTLSSRFTQLNVGYLTPSDISMILIRIGYTADRVAEMVESKLGSVYDTIENSKFDSFKGKALEMIAALKDGEVRVVDSMYAQWEDEHTQTLLDLAKERITGRYRRSSEEELSKLTKPMAMRILTIAHPFERPRYLVRAHLARIAKDNEQ